MLFGSWPKFSSSIIALGLLLNLPFCPSWQWQSPIPVPIYCVILLGFCLKNDFVPSQEWLTLEAQPVPVQIRGGIGRLKWCLQSLGWVLYCFSFYLIAGEKVTYRDLDTAFLSAPSFPCCGVQQGEGDDQEFAERQAPDRWAEGALQPVQRGRGRGSCAARGSSALQGGLWGRVRWHLWWKPSGSEWCWLGWWVDQQEVGAGASVCAKLMGISFFSCWCFLCHVWGSCSVACTQEVTKLPHSVSAGFGHHLCSASRSKRGLWHCVGTCTQQCFCL